MLYLKLMGSGETVLDGSGDKNHQLIPLRDDEYVVFRDCSVSHAGPAQTELEAVILNRTTLTEVISFFMYGSAYVINDRGQTITTRSHRRSHPSEVSKGRSSLYLDMGEQAAEAFERIMTRTLPAMREFMNVMEQLKGPSDRPVE